ncbi:MAG: hypothetical protein OES57_18270 [Acidimicrobiia bacterium]|nr:hypothetical protein [Acidimicrobiia bacterium]
MYAVATFLVVASITLVFTRLATGGLIATGMPPDIAGFQARSAFSGAGFTTTEAENVVNHPVRRRIIASTMFVGSLGTPTLVVTVMVGLLAPGPGSTTERTMVATAGLVLIILAVINRPMTRWLEGVGTRYAQRRLLPALDESAHELLSLGDDLVVVSARLADDPENSPRSLRGIEHTLPGVQVLGVRRGNSVVAEKPTDLTLETDDELILSGPRRRLSELGLLADRS